MTLITPELLASCNSESGHQKALFCWAAMHVMEYPEVGLLFSIPNGGLRSAKTGSRMRAEGAKSGVPDVFLPVARGDYHGLFIEMKNDRGHVSSLQAVWHTDLKDQGYSVVVCKSWQIAVNTILAYLAGE